ELMGLVFFCAGLLQSGSSIAAGRLADHIGLLKTMVFTHLPSNVLLILIPFMPTLGLAIAMLLARFAISQMDVPARQAYVVAVVEPGERTAAAAYTNTARYVVRPLGPALGGLLMENVALGAPFVAAVAVVTTAAALACLSGARWGAAGVFVIGVLWSVLGATDHYRAFLPGTFREGLSSRVWVWLIVGLQGAAAIVAGVAALRTPSA